ncbi:hypothetical protein D1007_10621 [Hordeum vulgare]|nr:hypothetical protein D1007_10621 [Hordeum vulgare]
MQKSGHGRRRPKPPLPELSVATTGGGSPEVLGYSFALRRMGPSLLSMLVCAAPGTEPPSVGERCRSSPLRLFRARKRRKEDLTGGLCLSVSEPAKPRVAQPSWILKRGDLVQDVGVHLTLLNSKDCVQRGARCLQTRNLGVQDRSLVR